MTPSIRFAPTVSEIAPPCVSAPAAAKIPIRNAARIVETALAPIAGANGGELLFAPSDHAINNELIVANTTSAQKPETSESHHVLILYSAARVYMCVSPPATFESTATVER